MQTDLPNLTRTDIPDAPNPVAGSAANTRPAGFLIGIALGIMGLVLITSVSLAVFYYRLSQQNNIAVPPSQITHGSVTLTPAPDSTPTPALSSTPLPVVKLELGPVSWFQYPKVLKNPGLVITDHADQGDYYASYKPESAKYHQVGSFSDGSLLINLFIDSEGMGSTQELHRLILTSAGQYYLINDKSNLIFILSPTVKLAEIIIDGLYSPDQLKLSKVPLERGYASFFEGGYHLSFTQLQSPRLYEETEFGPVYVDYSFQKEYSPVANRYFYLRHKDDTVSFYNTRYDFVTDDGLPQFQLEDGSANNQRYQNGIRGGGCGGKIGTMVPSGQLDLSAMVNFGTITRTANSSKTLYRIVDPENPVLKLIYKEYQIGRSEETEGYIKTVSDFAKQQTHFIWPDDAGDWHIFTSEKYTSLAECAKPVIYLYPETETKVNVRVAADVTQSDPVYPEYGWMGVTAKPNGQLTYKNQTYSSLFWEGRGKGLYPDHAGQGIVVAQPQLVSTLKNQLTDLGLNQQEASDFLEFWQPKLPTTPYIRLTWLDTADMDQLAPLSVSPTPDTHIRIFLEFEGLDKFVNLQPQKLTTPRRSGFTLVEWGGLLLK